MNLTIRYLSLPDFGNDYDNRVARTLQTVTYVMLVAGVLGVGIAVFDGDMVALAGVLTSVIALFGAIVLMHRGNITLSAAIVPALVFGLATYLTVTASGMRSTAVIMYLIAIIMAATLSGRQATIAYTLMTGIAVVITSLLAMNGMVVTGPLVEYIGLPDVSEALLYIATIGALLWRLVTNLMASLELARENEQKLAALNAELEQRVAERTAQLAKAKEEAEAARDRALEADRVKSQFLASMSHELRTPLNSILTFNELMQMEAFGSINTEQKDYLGKMLGSGRHLLALINDVLDITKLNSGMMQMHVEEGVDLHDELDTVISTAESMLSSKPTVTLVTEVAPSLPSVRGDRRRIKQVMLNLISNACKFTELGTVCVRAGHTASGQFLFEVTDTGPGIPADQHTVIFDPFIQTETGIKHAGGTGLGLPISKRLVEKHGGTLSVTSQPGEGATFSMILPEASHAV